MARRTSIDAYNTIKENGLLSQRRLQVYEFVFKNGPCTARQATKAMIRQGLNSGSVSTRFSELRNVGVLEEVGETTDEETNQTVILWDVTDNLPIKFEKSKKRKCKYCKGTGIEPNNQARFDI